MDQPHVRSGSWLAAVACYCCISGPLGSAGEFPPVVEPDTYEVMQGASLAADGVGENPAGVLVNDEDALRVSLVRDTMHGELVLRPDGTFSYVPQPNFVGVDSFLYSGSGAVQPRDLVRSDAAWKYLHPLDGVDPALEESTFHRM